MASQPSDNERIGILVLGMHRSGTSAIARVVNLLGAEIGNRLIAGEAGINDAGYWEDADVVDLHDRFLAGAGRSWHDPRQLPARCHDGAAVDDAVAEIRDKLRREFCSAPLWVVKDPRLSRLSHLWLPAMRSEGVRPVFLLAVRHPAEVVASLLRRDGMPESQGLLLWMRHVLEALQASSGHARAVSEYGELMRDWRAQLGRVGQQVGIEWPRLETAAQQIDAFLREDQRRHRSDDDAGDRHPLWRDAMDLYKALLELSAGRGDWSAAERIAARAQAAVDDAAPLVADVLEHAWQQSQRAERAQRLLDRERALLRDAGGVSAVLGRIDELHEAVADLIRQRDQANERSLAANADRESARAEAETARAEAETARAEAETARASLVAVQAEVAEREHRLADAQAELLRTATREQQLQRSLSDMQASRSWRITAPLRALAGRTRRLRGLAGFLRPRAGRSLERIYRALPLPGRWKLALKAGVFRIAAPLLRNTGAYRRWAACERTHAADPVAVDRHAPEAVAATAVWAGDDGVRPANGIWEWQDYHAVRERIDAELMRRQAEKHPRPRALLDFDGKSIDEAAARIRLPAPGERPDVTILIPAYNHVRRTLECLASIAAATDGEGPGFEVLVADDASSDETARVLPTIANLRVVRQPENLGFLRNCNAAAREARGRHLLLLNNDVQVCKGWLAALVACIEADEGIGAVGPRIVYPSGWLQEAGTALRRDGTSEMVGLNDLPDAPRYAYTRDVDYVSGACLLLRSEDFRRLGGFDEAYAPAYCEDSDLCMRLRAEGRRIVYCAEAEIAHHLSVTSDQLPNDYKLRCIARNLHTFSTRWQADLDRMDDVRAIAFYLPQFHPIPENDLWWGRGFTEWTNVSKARPNFVGHYQPRLPADLGFYDLRLPEVMEKQAALAKRYGIGGFCFYYYWFAGHRLLERPLENMLASGRPDMPFCLCWANENWTRRWDGEEHDVLMGQHHSDEDDIAVIRDLIRYFRSPNYIRIDGKPLLVVYRVGLFPDFRRTAERWRQVCRDEGVGDIYLAQVESFEMVTAGVRPDQMGCDAAIEFPPHGMAEPYPLAAPLLNPDFQGAVADYRDLAVRYATRELPAYKRFLGVATGWDNTARRQNNSYCFEHATPGAFQAWLEEAIARTRQQFSGDERLLFINAWNEWAEGAYLEPDRRYGHGFLQAVANARDARHLLRQRHYSLG